MSAPRVSHSKAQGDARGRAGQARPRGSTDCCERSGESRSRRTHARLPARASPHTLAHPKPHLTTTYLDVINKIIVQNDRELHHPMVFPLCLPHAKYLLTAYRQVSVYLVLGKQSFTCVLRCEENIRIGRYVTSVNKNTNNKTCAL